MDGNLLNEESEQERAGSCVIACPERKNRVERIEV